MGFVQTTVTATKTASFTPSAAASIYLVDATTGNITITLPVVARDPHSVYEFRRIDSSGHTVTLAGATDSTISPAVADTINGDASTTLAAGTALCLVSDGAAGWYDLSSNSGGALTPPVSITGTDLDARVLTIQAPAALTQPVVQISTTEGAVLWRLGVDMPNVVANWDTDTVDWTTTLYLSHRLSSGSPDVGVGVGLALAVDNGAGDDVPLAFLYTEATAVAPFAGRLGLLVLRPDGSYTAPIYITPTGLQLPLQTAPATPPPAGYVAFYADVADNHLKKQLPSGTVVDLG